MPLYSDRHGWRRQTGLVTVEKAVSAIPIQGNAHPLSTSPSSSSPSSSSSSSSYSSLSRSSRRRRRAREGGPDPLGVKHDLSARAPEHRVRHGGERLCTRNAEDAVEGAVARAGCAAVGVAGIGVVLRTRNGLAFGWGGVSSYASSRACLGKTTRMRNTHTHTWLGCRPTLCGAQPAQPVRMPAAKRSDALFSLFLCLSRACLGKLIDFN
jgi:hypothetical protein